MGKTGDVMSTPPVAPETPAASAGGPTMASGSPPSAPPGALPPLGAGGFARWAWRQLTSMRTALILLFALAIAAIPGSVLPQRGIDPILVREWIAEAPTWGPILDRLGFFDVYAAPWFAAIYLLLFISVIGCVLPRTSVHLKALRTPPPRAPRRLSRMAHYRTWTAEPHSVNGPASAAVVLDDVAADLRRRRWRVARGTDDSDAPDQQGGWVSAEKGYARETGNLLFHAALIALLIAVGVGAVFGWRGNVIVREGDGFSNTLTQYDAWGGGRLASPDGLPPFSFTLEEFRVEFERGETERGSPRLFEAEVTARAQPGAPDENRIIRVNEPIAYDGAKIFLVGHGYAPQIEVRDADGRLVFDDAVVVLPQDGAQTSVGVVKVPDALPQLGFQMLFLPTAAVDDVRGPFSSFPDADDPAIFASAWVGDLGLDDGVPQSVYRLVTDAMSQVGLEALRPGQTWELPDGIGSMSFVGWQRWASFQIAHDPGKEPALIASGLALIGLMLSLFVKRRRVWVRASDSPDGVVIEVAGLARTDEADLGDDVELVAQAAGAAPDAEVDPTVARAPGSGMMKATDGTGGQR
jgi:cytochrome c biogenesis protein